MSVNPIMAKILAEREAKAKAAQANPTAQQPAQQAQAPQAIATTTTQPQAKPMSELDKRLAAQRAAIASRNPAAGLVGGAAIVNAAPNQSMQVAELQQAKAVSSVLTAQQQATDQAKNLIQRRAEEGFYQIAHPESLPAELPATIVEQKLLELDAALLARTPDLSTLVVKINQNLRQYEELAYLLNDEQLHLVVESNLAAAGVMISSGKATDKTQAARIGQKLDSLTLDDFS